MIKYDEFKELLVSKIKDYLPENYKEWNITVSFTPKVNGFLETVTIAPEEGEYVIPNIYINDFYDYYKDTNNIEKAINKAADFFLKGMEYGKDLRGKTEEAMTAENIIMTLINKTSNRDLLAKCPHRDVMDLSIIYRWIMELPDGSFNSAIIMDDLEKRFGLGEEDLYEIALENTERIFPPLIENISEDFSILTNKRFIHGATSILYENQLKKLALKMKSNLYILPSSIHEVIAIPDNDRSPEDLIKMVKEANEEVVEPKEVLSDTVYYYDMDLDKLSMVKDCHSYC